MKKKNKLFYIFLYYFFFHSALLLTKLSNQFNQNLRQKFLIIEKLLKQKILLLLTANDYATLIGYEVLKDGGNAVDSAVAIQMTLGLVEPQSSGLGGGLFITYFDVKTKKIYSYEGREKSLGNIPNTIFLDQNGNPKKFFEAAN